MMNEERRFGVGSALTLVVALVIAALALSGGRVLERTTSLDPVSEPNPAARAARAGMQQVPDAEQAAIQAGHDVLTARDLDGETLSSTWVNRESGDVLEVYESGLTILTEIPEIGPDPRKYYEAVVLEAARPSVFVTDVGGIAALGVEPNSDELGSNPGLLRFASGDLSIVVSGADMSVEYLLGVATQLSVAKSD